MALQMLSPAHRTALALQQIVEGLADVNVAITSAATTDELFSLWSQFAPLMVTGLALQDRVASRVDALLAKDGCHAKH